MASWFLLHEIPSRNALVTHSCTASVGIVCRSTPCGSHRALTNLTPLLCSLSREVSALSSTPNRIPVKQVELCSDDQAKAAANEGTSLWNELVKTVMQIPALHLHSAGRYQTLFMAPTGYQYKFSNSSWISEHRPCTPSRLQKNEDED